MSVKVRERPAGSGVYWVFVDHKGRRKAKKMSSREAADEEREPLRKAG